MDDRRRHVMQRADDAQHLQEDLADLLFPMRPLHPHAEQLAIQIFLDHAEARFLLLHLDDAHDVLFLALLQLFIHLRPGMHGKALHDVHPAHDRAPGQRDLLVFVFFQRIDPFQFFLFHLLTILRSC